METFSFLIGLMAGLVISVPYAIYIYYTDPITRLRKKQKKRPPASVPIYKKVKDYHSRRHIFFCRRCNCILLTYAREKKIHAFFSLSPMKIERPQYSLIMNHCPQCKQFLIWTDYDIPWDTWD